MGSDCQPLSRATFQFSAVEDHGEKPGSQTRMEVRLDTEDTSPCLQVFRETGQGHEVITPACGPQGRDVDIVCLQKGNQTSPGAPGPAEQLTGQ